MVLNTPFTVLWQSLFVLICLKAVSSQPRLTTSTIAATTSIGQPTSVPTAVISLQIVDEPEICPAFTVATVVKYVTTTTPRERYCPSFVTRLDIPPPWSSCAFDTSDCFRIMCLNVQTIIQPCITDACCTATSTETLYATCPKSCPTGCATSWSVVRRSCPTPVPAIASVKTSFSTATLK